MKLFDSVVKPILLYGSQTWCQSLLSCITKDDFGQLDKLPFEDVHNKLCKTILNVGRRTSNLAARAEMGRYPLTISIAVYTFKFMSTIMMSPEKLSYHALMEEMSASKKEDNNFITFCQCILKRCNIPGPDSNVFNVYSLKCHEIRSTLERQYVQSFFNRINSQTGQDGKSGNKLRTYKTVKTVYECEPYVNVNIPPVYVSMLAKIRKVLMTSK